MRVALLVLVCLAAVVSVQSAPTDYQTEFTSFVKKFSKSYSHDEFFSRFNIFKNNFDFVNNHNQKNSTFTLAINEFADMTFVEFKKQMTGFKPIDNSYVRSLNNMKVDSAFEATPVDWRTKNAVTPIKNQQQCGSCWAFSAIGSTEGANAIATGTLTSLSEQQLVDCSGPQGNQGCNGGLMDNAFQYIITNGGVCTEAEYPYTASQGWCKKTCTQAAKLSSFQNVPAKDETALAQALLKGPVSVAIEADTQVFQFYSSGILSDSGCGTNLDHGVLLVAYGVEDSTSTPYWTIKNSWGTTWGESGYIRFKYGVNECGLSQMASYPVV